MLTAQIGRLRWTIRLLVFHKRIDWLNQLSDMSPIEVTLSVVQFLLDLVSYSSRLPLLEDFQRRTPLESRVRSVCVVLHPVLFCQ
jgi:hypothetical protein